MRTTRLGALAIACSTLFLALSVARAEQPSGDPPPLQPGAEQPSAEQPAPSAPAPAPAARDALRQQCEAAIRDDAEWRTELKENLARRLFEAPQTKRDEELRDMVRYEAHKAETQRLARDKQHVIYAYGALWILTALFVLYMYTRQRTLNTEIARLRREIEEAAES